MDYNTINNRRVAEEFKGFASEERHDFIKKVYSILILMLLFTAGTTAIFLEVESVRDFVRDHYIPIMIPAIVFLFVLLFMMICIPTCRYRSPHNYICLFSFTALMSLLVGVVTSYYKTNIVFLAFSATAFIAVSLTAFTFQTKYDFTGWGPYLLCFLIGLIFMGIIQIFVRDQILETVKGFSALLRHLEHVSEH